jgi:hypothetical protein
MTWKPDLRAGTWAYRAVALCCVLLIALTGFVAAVHSHANDSGIPNHSCSVCALAHAGVAPAELQTAPPVLVRSVVFHASPQTALSLLLVSSQFIRPPPLG